MEWLCKEKQTMQIGIQIERQQLCFFFLVYIEITSERVF